MFNHLQLEVRAIPIDHQEIGDELKKMRKTTSNRSIEVSDMTYGGHLAPVLDTPYEPTVKEKNYKFHAITVMKASHTIITWGVGSMFTKKILVCKFA